MRLDYPKEGVSNGVTRGNPIAVRGHGTGGGDRVIAGRYRLLDVIGSGGAGTVWTAVDEVLGREVAVKDVVPPWLGDHERELVRERTLREARAACRIDHPNVVEIFDVVEQDGRPWIVMQLIKAPSLAQVIEENGPCEPGQVAWIGLQLLGALRAAHAHGITHRDVKPSNVLVDGEHAVLTDFGIATIDGESSLTAPDTLVGAPSYIAPERVQGAAATAASDLWSLGATLYTAVEGHPPHMGQGLIAILTAVATGEPEPPVNAGALAPVLDAMLRKDPAQRPNAAQAERYLRRMVWLIGDGDGTADLDAAVIAETARIDSRQLLDQDPTIDPLQLLDRHTTIDSLRRVDQLTAIDPEQGADRPTANTVPGRRSRRPRTLAGAAAVVLLAVMLAGMMIRPALLPGSPVYQLPPEPDGNPSTTSTTEPAEQLAQVGNMIRPNRSGQPPLVRPSSTQLPADGPPPTEASPPLPESSAAQRTPVQPSSVQPSSVQPPPVQPTAEPTLPPPTTQPPEPIPTGTSAAPTSEPPPPATQGSPVNSAEISGAA